jgi:hypothetical protein
LISTLASQNRAGNLRFGLSAEERLLILAWLLVQTLDVLTTAFGLRAGLQEGNGFAAFVIEHYGELAAYGFKALVTFAVVGCVLLFRHRYTRLWLGLRIISIYMLVVVASNLVQIALAV